MGMGTKLAIGLLGMSIDMGWYLIVALALTGTGAVDWLRAKGVLIYRITAVALWLFAASVVVTFVITFGTLGTKMLSDLIGLFALLCHHNLPSNTVHLLGHK